LNKLTNQSRKKFPWLLSNLKNPKTGMPVLPCQEYHIIQTSTLKIGFMGLIEYDWVFTQPSLKPSDYEYEDFITKAKKLVKFLKNNNCDVIIALTHMRNYNDK
jgi:5'-nucleotidase